MYRTWSHLLGLIPAPGSCVLWSFFHFQACPDCVVGTECTIQPPYLGGVLMALTLCRKKNSIGCQDHGFFSTNCQPTCHFSTKCQDNFCLQYASGSRTTSFKKYKKTLCREVFFAPFFSTMCQFFSSMRCPGFFRFFKKKLLFCQWWSRAHCRVFSSCFKSSEC